MEYLSVINGIKPQGKPWTLFPTPRVGELNHIFSSAEAEREGGLKDTLSRLLDEVAPEFIFYLCAVDMMGSDALGTPFAHPAGLFGQRSLYTGILPSRCSAAWVGVIRPGSKP